MPCRTRRQLISLCDRNSESMFAHDSTRYLALILNVGGKNGSEFLLVKISNKTKLSGRKFVCENWGVARVTSVWGSSYDSCFEVFTCSDTMSTDSLMCFCSRHCGYLYWISISSLSQCIVCLDVHTFGNESVGNHQLAYIFSNSTMDMSKTPFLAHLVSFGPLNIWGVNFRCKQIGAYLHTNVAPIPGYESFITQFMVFSALPLKIQTIGFNSFFTVETA